MTLNCDTLTSWSPARNARGSGKDSRRCGVSRFRQGVAHSHDYFATSNSNQSINLSSFSVLPFVSACPRGWLRSQRRPPLLSSPILSIRSAKYVRLPTHSTICRSVHVALISVADLDTEQGFPGTCRRIYGPLPVTQARHCKPRRPCEINTGRNNSAQREHELKFVFIDFLMAIDSTL